MSRLTMCNYCSLKAIEKRAEKSGSRVIKKSSLFMGGTNIFVVPIGEELPPYKEPSNKLPNGYEVYQKYHKAWMMEIPNHCCC